MISLHLINTCSVIKSNMILSYSGEWANCNDSPHISPASANFYLCRFQDVQQSELDIYELPPTHIESSHKQLLEKIEVHGPITLSTMRLWIR